MQSYILRFPVAVVLALIATVVTVGVIVLVLFALDHSQAGTSQAGGAGAIPRKYGLIVLDKGPCPPGPEEHGYSQGGNGSVIIDGAGAMINADCDPSLTRVGTGDLVADGDIDVTGSVTSPGSGSIDPPPRDHVPWQVEDPLAALTPPYPDCLGWTPPCVTRKGSPVVEDLLQVTGSTDVTLSPGVYYGGIKVNCSCTVTFLPGIFIMAGGGFTKTGSTNIQGDDVMLFVTKHPTESVASDGEGFHFSGTGTTSLLGLLYCYDFGPPCLDPYENTRITFWQDESVTDDFEFAGDADGSTGIWYAPNANLKVTGGANFGTGQIIVDTIEKTGSQDLIITYEAFVEIVLIIVSAVGDSDDADGEVEATHTIEIASAVPTEVRTATAQPKPPTDTPPPPPTNTPMPPPPPPPTNTAAPPPPPQTTCDPSYPTVCAPPPPP